MMNQLLSTLFPRGCEIREEGALIFGTARVAEQKVELLGITGNAPLGIQEALGLSRAVLSLMEEQPGVPLVLLVATRGQKMHLQDELLGLNQALAHLCQCLEMARQRGHRLVAVIHGEALGGALIATALMADTVIALPGATPSVMPMEGIARVTKLPLAFLEELSRTNPVFKPGAESFYQVGGIDRLNPDDPAAALAEALAQADTMDRRLEAGAARGGRTMAWRIVQRILQA